MDSFHSAVYVAPSSISVYVNPNATYAQGANVGVAYSNGNATYAHGANVSTAIILTPPPFKALMAALSTPMTAQVQPQQLQEAPLIGAMVRALLQMLREVRLAGLMVQVVQPLQRVAILEAGVDKSI